MRFALLGDHPDGLDMARALVASGRHEFGAYSGSTVGLETLRRWGLQPPIVPDMEEALADPAIEVVLVAGRAGDRANQLRRALQSERHVLCVHPADQTPDTGHEAAMLQADTMRLLMPVLPDSLHPALERLAQLIHSAGGFRLLELERWSADTLLLDADEPGHKPGLPGWDILRRLGGEIAEVSAYAAGEGVDAEEPLLVAGRFENGALFRELLVPRRPETRWRLVAWTAFDRLELNFPEGWPGPAMLTWRNQEGRLQQEHFVAWNPWAALVVEFDARFDRRTKPAVTWVDAIHCLELDDAARRSVQRRRSSTLEYQEATEEAGFKGTMTLLGCGLLWGSVVMLIVALWVPWILYFMVPVFGLFLLLQFLRWFVPPKQDGPTQPVG